MKQISELEDEKNTQQERFRKLQQSLEDQVSQSTKSLNEQKAKEQEIEGKVTSIKGEKERLTIELNAAEERAIQIQEELRRSQQENEQTLREHRNQLRTLQSSEEKRRGNLKKKLTV